VRALLRGTDAAGAEAPTAQLRELAATLARHLVLERWDPVQDRWVPDRDPVIERRKEEQGLSG